MHRNDTAGSYSAPHKNTTHPIAPTAAPGKNHPASTIALIGQLKHHRRKAIVLAGAIAIATLYWLYPPAAIGVLFAGGLFGINTLIDGHMGGVDR